jgi:hypothetical protein
MSKDDDMTSTALAMQTTVCYIAISNKYNNNKNLIRSFFSIKTKKIHLSDAHRDEMNKSKETKKEIDAPIFGCIIY